MTAPAPIVSPWHKDAPARRPLVVTGLQTLPHEDRVVMGGNLVYAEGYKTKFKPKGAAAQRTLLEGFARLRGSKTEKGAPIYLLDLDREHALATWNDLSIRFVLEDFHTRMVIAVYGLDAVPGALARIGDAPEDVVDGLERVAALAVAPAMAALATSKKKPLRDGAVTWLVSWPRTAAIALVPVAVGELGAARSAAEAALRLLALRRQGAAVRDIAAAYGAEASAAMDEVLGYCELPAKAPALPEWARAGRLPALAGVAGGTLDAASTETLLALLCASPPELVDFFVPFDDENGEELEDIGRNSPQHVARFHPAVLAARAALEPGSRAAFAGALCDAWLAAGGSAKDKWALFASSALGTDANADALFAAVLAGIKDKKSARVRLVLDALALLGTPRALAYLAAVAERKAHKDAAQCAADWLATAARERAMSADELADITTPDPAMRLAVAAGSALTFDAAGGLVAPAGAKGAELKAWKEASDEAKRAASAAVLRYERAMVERRRFTVSYLRCVVAPHPILARVVAPLVLGRVGADGGIGASARLESGRLVGRDGAELDAGEDDVFSVLHPIDLAPAERAAWGDALAELAVVQPFAQLGRPVFAVEAKEKKATAIARFDGKDVATGALLGLVRLGWGTHCDDRTVVGLVRAFGGMHAHLPLKPGYDVRKPDPKATQTLGPVAVRGIEGVLVGAPLALGRVDALAFSELVRELALAAG